MGTKEFILAMARGARGKDAAKALILPDILGGVAPVDSGVELTVTGATPLTLPNALKKPVVACTTNILPVQDLHGYDAPWPSGGGVNKLDIGNATPVGPSYGLTKTIDANGYVHLDGVVTGGTENLSVAAITVSNAQKEELTGMGYVISVTDVSGGTSLSAWGLRDIDNGVIALSVVNPGNGEEMHMKFRFVVATTSQTTWTPYSNICPIVGWDGAEVTVDPLYGGDITWNQVADKVGATGHGMEDWASTITKNADGSVTVATTRDYTEMGFGFTTGKTYVGGHKYLLSITIKSCSFTPTNVGLFTTNAWSNIGQVTMAYAGTKEYATILTTTANGDSGNVQRFNVRLIGTSLSGDSFTFTSAFCCDLTEMFGAGNEPSTVEEFRAMFPLDYYPYNAGTVTNVSAVSGLPYSTSSVTFDSTVYGGSYEFVGGQGSVDRGRYVFTGDEVWIASATPHRFSIMIDRLIPSPIALQPMTTNAKQNVISEAFGQFYYKNADGVAYVVAQSGGNLLVVNEPSADTIEEIAQLWAGTAIVYELATPTPFTADGADIKTQKGQNYAWSDCGDTMSVTYIGKQTN